MQAMEPETVTNSPRHLLFLDGECVFCQRSAQLIHRLDKNNLINFAPLQGETAAILPETWKPNDESNQVSDAVVLVENLGERQTLWRGADAALRTLKLIGGVWAVFWPLHYLPKWLKSSVYRLIAKNRYRIAGKGTVCELPDKMFKSKMLP